MYPGTPLELLRIVDRMAGLTQGKVDAALLRVEVTSPGLHTELLLEEERVVVMAPDSPLAALSHITLADLAAHPIAVNTVYGTTTPDLWPQENRPATFVEVSNTDEWLMAIAAGRAVGITTTATPSNHTHPTLVYRRFTDAPPVPVVLAWREGPGHPAIRDLVRLAHEVLADEQALGRQEHV
jgi:DNA-binding transcriptional LysR family regulator